jgi:hypothetical protein
MIPQSFGDHEDVEVGIVALRAPAGRAVHDEGDEPGSVEGLGFFAEEPLELSKAFFQHRSYQV